FVRAGEEDVEDRQSAFQFLRLQVDLHILGDEKTEAERGMLRLLEIVQGGRQIRRGQRIGRRPHRFLSAKNINRCFGKKLIDVKKIWPTEHVKCDRHILTHFRKILCLPCVQFLQLSSVKFGESLFESRG